MFRCIRTCIRIREMVQYGQRLRGSEKMTEITFLHAADLHLDSPYIGLRHLPEPLLHRVQESTFVSLQRLVDVAINKKVDFIIIAGDLYDAEQRSLKAQIRVRDEMKRLEQEGIQVFIVHGNHDPLTKSKVEIKWPSNVHIFKEEVEVIPFIKEGKTAVNLYGFSYVNKAITENMSVKYEKKEGADYHIAILHGTLSSIHDHVPYAPFQLSDLKQNVFDYWALGHIHQKQVLSESPLIIYPGNTQGRHKKETGEKGCFHVKLHDSIQEFSFIETCDILWESVEISITSLQTLDELVHLCKQTLSSLRETEQGVFVNLKLVDIGEIAFLLKEDVILDDLVSILQDGEEELANFVWVSSIENKTQLIRNHKELKSEFHFIGDLLQQVEEYTNYEEALSPLYRHRLGRKYLSPLSQAEKEEILKEAESLILNELLKTTT